jgi:hypothetical protein
MSWTSSKRRRGPLSESSLAICATPLHRGCAGDTDWPEVGSRDYDDLIEFLALARDSVNPAEPRAEQITAAAGSVDRLVLAIRENIERELGKYT